ncbi:vacuolar protein 8-like isoform X2 [Haliotis rufescens]|uniref:vacuolar protein 8-like isoform X2 n=1 Tax=Haliotis rufescens TaxID=6454 RepID=UPI001EB0968A|nr:vacuolar protein 8-like isoform X2 [Haliotis rufescens]
MALLGCRIKLEGQDVYPARVDGPADVYQSPRFILTKARWVEDKQVSTCILCNNKFNQIRRKHHCRQCGLVLCNKCCKERMPLPQLGIEDAERVCDACAPVTQLITKARSQMHQFQVESADGLTERCKNHNSIKRVVELGGIQTLIVLAQTENVQILRSVMSGLQALATHQPLHQELATAGAIKVICSILSRLREAEEQILTDGISSLMIFCKSPELKKKALDDGALNPVLTLCMYQSPTLALLALCTLSLIVENPDTHDAIVESSRNALPRILALTASSDEQTQEVALKILAHLSNGTDWHRHRIVQEDFSSGCSLHKALSSHPQNEQILCNAVCLIGNLATSAEDQSSLQSVMVRVCQLLQNSPSNCDLKIQLSRAIANFSKFKQNSDRLVPYVSDIVQTCIKSTTPSIRVHGMRAILSLLSYSPCQTTAELMRDGAVDLLESLGKVHGLLDSVQATLTIQAAALTRPL